MAGSKIEKILPAAIDSAYVTARIEAERLTNLLADLVESLGNEEIDTGLPPQIRKAAQKLDAALTEEAVLMRLRRALR